MATRKETPIWILVYRRQAKKTIDHYVKGEAILLTLKSPDDHTFLQLEMQIELRNCWLLGAVSYDNQYIRTSSYKDIS